MGSSITMCPGRMRTVDMPRRAVAVEKAREVPSIARGNKQMENAINLQGVTTWNSAVTADFFRKTVESGDDGGCLGNSGREACLKRADIVVHKYNPEHSPSKTIQHAKRSASAAQNMQTEELTCTTQ